MAVTRKLTRPAPLETLALRVMAGRPALLLVAGFAVGTLILRLPTFFEPPWHTDEGIFAAVAQKVVSGGQLYADAWESKPPLFLYIYVAVAKLFGAGVLPLRLVVAGAALASELALLAIGLRIMGRRQALLAAGILAVLLAVPFWEGNLASPDALAVMPTTLAVLCVLSHDRGHTTDVRLLLAGLLFGLAFLIRQPSAVVAAAVVVWLLLDGRPWLRSGLLIAGGALAVVAPVVLAFALFGSLRWFWDANVDFFLSYVPSGREVPFQERPLIFLPALAAVGALFVYRRRGAMPRWGLPALWLTFTLAAALLSGRPYPHYLLPAFPPLALLLAMLAPHVRPSWRPRREHAPALGIALSVALLWLAVVRPAFGGNLLAMHYTRGPTYYANFAAWATGLKDREAYNDCFDRRVNLTRRLAATLEGLGARDQSVYIWGEYPWVYSLAGAEPATPYMTSFYVLLIPYLDVELGATLAAAEPRFIVMGGDAWPRVHDARGILPRRFRNATRALNALIAARYEQVAVVGRARVFQRVPERQPAGERLALDK